MQNWKISGFIATAIIVLSVPVYLLNFYIKDKSKDNTDQALYVGSESCIDCHQVEYKAWKGSHHDKAMDIASDSTVLGDFNNSEFTFNGITTKFYKRDGKYYVYTNGPGGKLDEFEITHTFGFTPLQQYLVPFENGRYQCLPIAWDTEKEEWFSLVEATYGDNIPSSDDWLYWTNNGQNWNGMCAECHSTNLQKNFDPITKTYNTTYSEIDVGCEACHGPGSKHNEWANLPEMARPSDTNFDLLVQTRDITNREYVDLCAYCHSRRSSLGPLEFTNGNAMDLIIPRVLDENYFPDGQILEEDYVYGSFLHSKMYDRDVKCNDCHDVHSGERIFEGNKLCAQCHHEEVYDNYDHHFHKKEGEEGNPIITKDRTYNVGEGALCVNCHMPGRYYMGNDFRNDHSFRIPRPDLTSSIGVPNACNQCHEDKSVNWSIDYINQWYGEKRKPHFGSIFSKGREGDSSVMEDIIRISKDDLYLPIVRATAVSLIANYQGEKSESALIYSLADPEAIVRYNALHALATFDSQILMQHIFPLLNDPVKSIRIESAFKLSALPKNQLTQIQIKQLNNVLQEYISAMNYSADFAGSRHNLGILNSNLQNFEEAAKQYKEAIEIDSLFYPAKVNLSVVLNQLGRNDEAEKILRDLINKHPEFYDSYYSLGLLLADKKEYDEAVENLNVAARLMPDRARIFYNLGLILQFQGNNSEAERTLKKAASLEPMNIDFKYALADHYIKNGNLDKAREIANVIKNNFPDIELGDQILNYLNNLEEK